MKPSWEIGTGPRIYLQQHGPKRTSCTARWTGHQPRRSCNQETGFSVLFIFNSFKFRSPYVASGSCRGECSSKSEIWGTVSLFLSTSHRSMFYLPVSVVGPAPPTRPQAHSHSLFLSPHYARNVGVPRDTSRSPLSSATCRALCPHSSLGQGSGLLTEPLERARPPAQMLSRTRLKGNQNVTGSGSRSRWVMKCKGQLPVPKKSLRKFCSSLSTPVTSQPITALHKPGMGSHSPEVN